MGLGRSADGIRRAADPAPPVPVAFGCWSIAEPSSGASSWSTIRQDGQSADFRPPCRVPAVRAVRRRGPVWAPSLCGSLARDLRALPRIGEEARSRRVVSGVPALRRGAAGARAGAREGAPTAPRHPAADGRARDHSGDAAGGRRRTAAAAAGRVHGERISDGCQRQRLRLHRSDVRRGTTTRVVRQRSTQARVHGADVRGALGRHDGAHGAAGGQQPDRRADSRHPHRPGLPPDPWLEDLHLRR